MEPSQAGGSLRLHPGDSLLFPISNPQFPQTRVHNSDLNPPPRITGFSRDGAEPLFPPVLTTRKFCPFYLETPQIQPFLLAHQPMQRNPQQLSLLLLPPHPLPLRASKGPSAPPDPARSRRSPVPGPVLCCSSARCLSHEALPGTGPICGHRHDQLQAHV